MFTCYLSYRLAGWLAGFAPNLQLRLVHGTGRIRVCRQPVPLAVATMANIDRRVKDGRLGGSLSLPDIDVLPLTGAHVQLTGPPDLDTARLEHLLPPVCKPTDASGNGEQDWVEAERGGGGG